MNNETQPITVVFACPRCGTVCRVSQYRGPGEHFGVFNRVSCHAQIYAWSGDYDFLDWQVWASVSRRARRNKSRGPVGRLVAQDSHGDCEERASTRMVPIAKIRISCFVWGSSIVCPTLKGAGGSAPMAPPMEARPACECSVCRPRSRRPGSRGHLTDNPSANRQFRRLPSTCAERAGLGLGWSTGSPRRSPVGGPARPCRQLNLQVGPCPRLPARIHPPEKFLMYQFAQN